MYWVTCACIDMSSIFHLAEMEKCQRVSAVSARGIPSTALLSSNPTRFLPP